MPTLTSHNPTADEKAERRRRESAEEAARLRAWQPGPAFEHLKAAELALKELYFEIDNNVAPWADLVDGRSTTG